MEKLVAVGLLSGAMVLLPVHAAGEERAEQAGSRHMRCAPDEPQPIPLWVASADTIGAATTTDFCADFLEGIPLPGRVYQDVLSLAPGVSDVDHDGNPNADGAREGELQVLPDGADGSDPVSGGFGQNLNLEALQRVRVVSTGASAVLGGAQGGFAPLTTRSGGNELAGAVKFFYRSDLFDGDGADNNDVTHGEPEEPAEFQAYSPFFRIGGPFRKDHAWYFLALQYQSDEVDVETFGGTLTSDARGWSNFGKISGALGDHRLALSVHYDDLEADHLGLGHLVDPDSGFAYEQGGTQTSLAWSFQPSSRLLVELLASHRDASIEVRPENDPAPCQPPCSVFEEDVYTLTGGLVSGPYYLRLDDDRERDQLRADVAFQLKGAPSHRFQVGVEWGRERLDGSRRQGPIRIDDFVAGGPGGAAGTISFLEAFPRHADFHTEKDTLGGYLQDVFTFPHVAIQVGLRLDREEIEADGWDTFDPAAEAAEFLQLLSLGSGIPEDDVNPLNPRIRFDINGDGRDADHCGVDFGALDRYDNDLITGFVVNENGTYVLVGDDVDLNGNGTPDYQEPDGVAESFFQFFDNGGARTACLSGPNAGQDCTVNADCPFSLCGSVEDGVASFDPALVGQVITQAGNYGNPAHMDSVLFDPMGGFFGDDASVENPNCDRLSEDTVFLFSVYSRHQFDVEEGPVTFPAGGLAGTPRRAERFRIDNDNLSPRLAIAWDPLRNNRSRVFATWGRYHGTLHLDAVSVESLPDLRTSVYDARNLGDPFAVPFAISRLSTRTVNRDLETPFTDEWVVGVEYRMADDWSVSLRYIHRDGHDLLQDVDRNHHVQDEDGDGRLDDTFGNLVPGMFGGLTREPDGLPDLFVRNPLFNQVLEIDNVNSSEYESYQLIVTRYLSRLWQMTASYVYSEATGDAETFASLVGDDPAIPDDDALVLAYDQTHAVKITGMGFLPHGQTFGGSIRWASGLPYSVVERQISYDSLDDPMLRTSYPEGSRNSVRNEGIWTVDLSYRKLFQLDDVQAGLSVEVFNALNSDDLTIYTVEHGSATGLDAVRRFGRRWQLGLELHF